MVDSMVEDSQEDLKKKKFRLKEALKLKIRLKDQKKFIKNNKL
jgi:hypothetical protein